MMSYHLLCDVRLACRALWRQNSLSTAAVLTLTLGIAGTTVMFSLVHGVLVRPLAVRDQGRLVVAWKDLPSSGFTHHPFGDTEIEAIGRTSQLLESVAGVDANGAGREVLAEHGESAYVKSALVTGMFFHVLGVDPILGRALTSADDVDGAEKVLVISQGLWTRRYGRALDLPGRRVTLGEQRFTIVGVMPSDVDYPNGAEIWRTTHSVSTDGPFGNAARKEIDLLARLRPAATIAQVRQELTVLTHRLESIAPPGTTRDLVPVVRRFEDVVVGDVRPAMMVLLAAVGLVLFIATANVSNLLLMRGEARRAELAVHEALGASRGRIVRQVILESLALTMIAAAAGLAVAWWSLPGVMRLVPDGLPRIESVRIDATVVTCTFLLGVIASCLAGLPPAMSAARADLIALLTSAGRGATGSPQRRYARRMLVIAQVALAVTIVWAAGLLTRSVLRLQAIDVGLVSDRLFFIELSLPQSKYSDRGAHARFLDQAVSELEAAPGIEAATPVNLTPFSGDGGWDVPKFVAEGQSAERAASNPALNLESVYPNYFATFQIPVVRGRAFTDADRSGALAVAIVSEEVAHSAWPGESPIGKRLKPGGVESQEKWLTVVGVAAPSRYRELTKPRPTIYLPAAQFLMTAEIIVLRSAASAGVVASLARDRIQTVDPTALVVQVVPFTRMFDAPLARPRFYAFLAGVFGVTALLLSTIGLYAVLAAHVRQRDREIAVRVALGAASRNLRMLVLGESLSLAAAGATIGLAGAIGATRFVRSLLYGIDALDWTTLSGAALVLIATALLASYVPMRRAMRVDGASLLRN